MLQDQSSDYHSDTSCRRVGVLICHDVPVIRVGLECLLGTFEEIEVLDTASSEEQLMERLHSHAADVVLLNLELPNANVATLARRLKQQQPALGVIILLKTVHSIWFALNAKADGYCHTEIDAEHLHSAVQTVSSNRAYMDPSISDYLLRGDGYSQLRAVRQASPQQNLEGLSSREKDVLRLMAEGKTNPELAEALGLSPQTVKVHVKHILRKLKAKDRTHAVVLALRSI